MASMMRGLVSKKKLRFQEDGFDLDLTYITDNIIAMGFPSVGREARYRNPLPEVQRFFNTRHPGHYKIYNLCSERRYEDSCFERCARYGFNDHNPSSLTLIAQLCQDVHEFLNADPKNVVAIHCKAGKGRTGMMICAYLVHTKQYSAEAALTYFGKQRTSNGKGVTIPSQMRYVYYYEQMLLHGPSAFTPKTYKVTHIRLVTVPNFDVGGGCDPYFQIRNQKSQKLFDYKTKVGKVKKFKKEAHVDLPLQSLDCYVQGDVKFVFFDQDATSSDDKMFHFWINTGFVFRNYLCLHKDMVDSACKDKKCKSFKSNFAVELFFEEEEDADVSGEIVDEIPPSDTEDEGDDD